MNKTAKYNEVFSFKKMYKAEGVGSFWKGIAAPLMVETPKRAWKFCTFENFKNALNYRGQDKQPSPLTYSMAGFLAGATEGIIVNPFEAIKVMRFLVYDIISIRDIFPIPSIIWNNYVINNFSFFQPRLKLNQIRVMLPRLRLLLLLQGKLHLKKVICTNLRINNHPNYQYLIFIWSILYLFYRYSTFKSFM